MLRQESLKETESAAFGLLHLLALMLAFEDRWMSMKCTVHTTESAKSQTGRQSVFLQPTNVEDSERKDSTRPIPQHCSVAIELTALNIL